MTQLRITKMQKIKTINIFTKVLVMSLNAIQLDNWKDMRALQ